MMLVKMLFCGDNYQKSLKRRRACSIAILCVGLIGFACYFLLVPGSALSDFAQGFYLGAASGITAGALILLIRTQYLLTHQMCIRDSLQRSHPGGASHPADGQRKS